jgi:replicative DNA helicase
MGAFDHEPAFTEHVHPLPHHTQTIRVQSRLNEDLDNELPPGNGTPPAEDPFDDLPPF